MNIGTMFPPICTLDSVLAQHGRATQLTAIDTQSEHSDQYDLLVYDEILIDEIAKRLDLVEEEEEFIARDNASIMGTMGLLRLGNFKCDVVWEVEVIINMIRHARSEIFVDDGTAFSTIPPFRAVLYQIFRAIIVWSTQHEEGLRAIVEDIERVKRSLPDFLGQAEGHALRLAWKVSATHVFGQLQPPRDIEKYLFISLAQFYDAQIHTPFIMASGTPSNPNMAVLSYHLNATHYSLMEACRLYAKITLDLSAMARPLNNASKRLLAEPNIYLRHHSTECIYELAEKKSNETRVAARAQDRGDD